MFEQSWSPERIAKVGGLLAAGYSASQAAAAMGCTRNAIVGIANRKKLAFKRRRAPATKGAKPQRKTPFRPKVRRRTNHGTRLDVVEVNAPRFVPAVRDPGEIPVPQRCSLLELDSSKCRWPYGEVGAPDFFFCGGPPAKDKPYCPYHCRISYRQPGQREE